MALVNWCSVFACGALALMLVLGMRNSKVMAGVGTVVSEKWATMIVRYSPACTVDRAFAWRIVTLPLDPVQTQMDCHSFAIYWLSWLRPRRLPPHFD